MAYGNDARAWDIDKARLLGVINGLHATIDGLLEANKQLADANRRLVDANQVQIEVNRALISTLASLPEESEGPAPPIQPTPPKVA
jgi:hypothetical protein